jgi:hypothetical protein
MDVTRYSLLRAIDSPNDLRPLSPSMLESVAAELRRYLRQHMTIRRLERSEWRSFCILATRYMIGKRAEIEARSLAMGRQVTGPRVPIHSVNYDPHRDVIKILLTGIEHLIYRPREVYVDNRPGGLLSFEVIDADGAQQIIMLHEPLMLPAPAAYLAPLVITPSIRGSSRFDPNKLARWAVCP